MKKTLIIAMLAPMLSFTQTVIGTDRVKAVKSGGAVTSAPAPLIQ